MAAQAAQASNEDHRISVVEIMDNTHGMKVQAVKVERSRFTRMLADAGKADCNQHNNQMATTAASRISTGLAMGCVVGNCYLLRKDGKNLSIEEWWELWDYLQTLMGDYGEGPGYVTQRLLDKYKRELGRKLQRRGIRRSGAGAKKHGLSTYHHYLMKTSTGSDDQNQFCTSCCLS